MSNAARLERTTPSPNTNQGKVSATQHVYMSLRAAILKMEIKPGTLLDETSLSEEFKVSRSPVREALIKLGSEHLVQTLRNRSTIVTQFSASDLPAYFYALDLMYRSTAKLAAAHRTDAQLQELIRIDRLHKSASQGDILGTVQGNRDFHCKVAECSANIYLLDWAETLMDQGQRLLVMYLKKHANVVAPSHLDHHGQLIEAIRDQDAARAEAAAHADAEVLRAEIAAALASSPSSSISI